MLNRIDRRNRRRAARKGAVLSMELIFVLPIVICLVLAVIEFGMLWSANQRVKEAASAACRIATFRGADMTAVRRAAEQTLKRSSLVSTYSIDIRNATPDASEIAVTVTVPMKAAAPDMLGLIGFGLGNRQMSASAVMRKE